MFAVVFEVHPADGNRDTYLDHASKLKPIIETIDGFIDNERFESRERPGWILSLSTWRDEKSVIRWRTQSNHHGIQELGRAGVFADYHLRVGEIVTDTQQPPGVPMTEQRFDETEIGEAKALAVTEAFPARAQARIADALAALGLDVSTAGLTEYDVFDSIYNPGQILLLASWQTAEQARRWQPSAAHGEPRHRVMRTVRDYGMFDRRETPQYFPPAPSASGRSARPGRL